MDYVMSNREFAQAVGCHITMASRLRNGKRMPSAQMLARILEAFGAGDFEPKDAMSKEAFGVWLRRHVFCDI